MRAEHFKNDEFNIVKFMYLNINASMKHALDLGTMVSDDPQKLRAYKEQIKKNARKQWDELGRALVYLGLADECICSQGDYCTICSGSRFVMSSLLASDSYVESGMATSITLDEQQAQGVVETLNKYRKVATKKVEALNRGEVS